MSRTHLCSLKKSIPSSTFSPISAGWKPQLSQRKDFNSHQKLGVIFALPILGVILPLFAFSWIDNSYYLISLVHGLLSFEFHSTIFNDIVFSDLTSHTCIISDILLDHGKKVSAAGIGAIKYIYYVYNIVIQIKNLNIIYLYVGKAKP